MNKPIDYISLVVPSRGRATRLRDMLSSVDATASGEYGVEVVVVLDSDDEYDYPRLSFVNVECIYIVGASNRTMGSLNLEGVRKAKGNIIFLCNDDVRFETIGWDRVLIKEIQRFQDGLYLLYPNDGLKKKKLATFPIFDRALLLNNPDLMPSCYKGSFIDLHIMDIFMELKLGCRIVYLDQVMCRHLHFSEDASLLDATYEKRDRFGDDSTFLRYSKRRKLLAARLEKVLIKQIICENSIVSLLQGRSIFIWRLRLFTYMIARILYRKLFV